MGHRHSILVEQRASRTKGLKTQVGRFVALSACGHGDIALFEQVRLFEEALEVEIVFQIECFSFVLRSALVFGRTGTLGRYDFSWGLRALFSPSTTDFIVLRKNNDEACLTMKDLYSADLDVPFSVTAPSE
jgi:hypothetical protein